MKIYKTSPPERISTTGFITVLQRQHIKILILSKGCSMVMFAFSVLNTWRVSKLLDKCLLRFDITTDSFVTINLLSAASDLFFAQFAEFYDEINLEMYDRFLHLDIYRNNRNRLTYRFLLADFRPLFFSSLLFCFRNKSRRFPYINCFFIFTTSSSSFPVLLRVSFGEDEESINPKFLKISLLLCKFVSLTSELQLGIA